MATRTKLLSWRNINTDSDFSKYIETVSEPWVIEWLKVSTNSVAVWKCWVPCERTNGETIYSLVESFTETSIDTSWTWYVIVEIGQTYIDDWSLINEDWTWVATIKVVSSLPLKNYLELASLSSWTITDTRNRIKKVWELNTAIISLSEFVDNIDERVRELEEVWAIDHLEEKYVVWERYTSTSQKMYVQSMPIASTCDLEVCEVWKVDNYKEIHIQKIANWKEWFNTVSLKVKKVWSPTTALKVEVRKWITWTSWSATYWYWDSSQILCSWSISYSSISSDFQVLTVELDNNIEAERWTLLDVVVYQESNWQVVVNSDNYYIIAVDYLQQSEAFCYVWVNWTSRLRTNYIPFCVWWAFEDKLLSKYNKTAISLSRTRNFSWTFQTSKTITVVTLPEYTTKATAWKMSATTQYYQTVEYNIRSSSWSSLYYHTFWAANNWAKWWTEEKTSQNLEISKWTNIQLSCGLYQYSESDPYSWYITYNFNLLSTIGYIVYIRNSWIQAVWSLVDCTTLWRHTDWEFKTDVIPMPKNIAVSSNYNPTASDITSFYWYITIRVWSQWFRVPISSSTIINYTD